MILTSQPHRLVQNPDYVISLNNIPISVTQLLIPWPFQRPHLKFHMESIRCKLRFLLGNNL